LGTPVATAFIVAVTRVGQFTATGSIVTVYICILFIVSIEVGITQV